MEALVQTDEPSAAQISKGCLPRWLQLKGGLNLLFERFQTYLRMKRMLTWRLAPLCHRERKGY